jgi:hypothetical protein
VIPIGRPKVFSIRGAFFHFKKPLSSGQTFKITARSGISLGSDLQNAEYEPQIFLSIGEWEIMCCASSKFSVALKSSRSQCLPVDLSKW